MKNIVFDLGGVLFARDKNKSTQEFHEFFSFIRSERMPLFWEEYDRGASTLGEVTDILARTTGCPRESANVFCCCRSTCRSLSRRPNGSLAT